MSFCNLSPVSPHVQLAQLASFISICIPKCRRNSGAVSWLGSELRWESEPSALAAIYHGLVRSRGVLSRRRCEKGSCSWRETQKYGIEVKGLWILPYYCAFYSTHSIASSTYNLAFFLYDLFGSVRPTLLNTPLSLPLAPFHTALPSKLL